MVVAPGGCCDICVTLVYDRDEASEDHTQSGGGRVQGATYVVIDNEEGTLTYTQCERYIL